MAERSTRSQLPNLHDFLAALDRDEVKPAYAVAGEEELLKSEAIAAIKAKALADTDPAMCYTEYEGDSADCRDVFDDLRTLPFLGKRRVVLLEKAHKFIQRFKKPLESYLASPASTGTLILSMDKLDARTKLVKTLLKWHSAVDCRRLYERQLPQWIAERVRSLGKRIDSRAAAQLAEQVGTDLGQLSSQIDKLVTYIGDRSRIEIDDVATLSDTDRTRTIFELTECMGRRDIERALTILNQLIRTGNEAVYIVTMLAWQLRRLWKIKRIASARPNARGESLVNEVRKAVGGHSFFIPDMIQQTRAFTEDDMISRYRMLLDCDIQLKSSVQDPKTALEILIFNLCRR